MKKKHAPSGTLLVERSEAEARKQKYILRLYIAGMTLRAREAFRTVSEICETELAGRCDLRVIDLCKQPTLAQGEQIIAIPTLIKKLPLPLRRFIGSMADREKILVGLDLRSR